MKRNDCTALEMNARGVGKRTTRSNLGQRLWLRVLVVLIDSSFEGLVVFILSRGYTTGRR